LSKLSLFFELIKDNSWHSINELSKALNVQPNRLSEMSKLLSEHKVIEYRQDTEEVKIDQKWKFICEEYDEHAEQNLSIGTIIISPEKSINLQGTTITNLTDATLELNIKVDKGIKEITINQIT
jgi:hypothetical protein